MLAVRWKWKKNLCYQWIVLHFICSPRLLREGHQYTPTTAIWRECQAQRWMTSQISSPQLHHGKGKQNHQVGTFSEKSQIFFLKLRDRSQMNTVIPGTFYSYWLLNILHELRDQVITYDFMNLLICLYYMLIEISNVTFHQSHFVFFMP